MIDENKFWDLVRQWEYDTRNISSANQILGHSSVGQIIQMGQEVIPLVLKAMGENYHFTFILHKLTGEWPVKEEFKGNGPRIINCWRKWARKHGYQT